MDGLELHVCQGGLQQRRSGLWLVMQEALEVAHAIQHLVRRRRHEGGVPWAGAPDPVLAAPELPWRLSTPAPISQKHTVDLAEQPQRQREAPAQTLETILERGHVVAHLAHVIQRHPRLLLQLEEQQIGERGLGALDHAGEHRLLAHVHVEEQAPCPAAAS